MERSAPSSMRSPTTAAGVRGGGEPAAAARRRRTWRRGHGGAAAAASALRAGHGRVDGRDRGVARLDARTGRAGRSSAGSGCSGRSGAGSGDVERDGGRPRGTARQHSAATSGAISRKLKQLLFWKAKLKQLLVWSGAGSGGAERDGAGDGRVILPSLPDIEQNCRNFRPNLSSAVVTIALFGPNPNLAVISIWACSYWPLSSFHCTGLAALGVWG